MVQSLTFWGVLALAVPIFWLLPVRLRDGFLFLVSFGYLATLDAFSAAAVFAWTLLLFFGIRWTARTPLRDPLLTGLILGIVGFLAYFKYLPPLIAQIANETPAAVVLVPLGISYFSFKLIHFAIETRRGRFADVTLSSFLSYMFLFPIFTAGPIQRFDDFTAKREMAWSPQLMAEALTRILYGLIKKFVLAELLLLGFYGSSVISGAELSLQVTSLSTADAWALLITTYLFIYLDFSAYTDIAIGCSRLFGFRIMENFRFPIIAQNISDFWRRWHISLSAWCQSYIYLPIIGFTRIPYLAALGSFLVIGVWHAATGPRLLWALFHFAGVAVFMTWNRLRGRRKPAVTGARRMAGIVLTQGFVTVSMAFLLAEGAGFATAVQLLSKLIPTTAF